MTQTQKLSLGWQTDLIFPRFDAEVIERSDYIVVRTPHNPTYYWGNFLLFGRAPRAGEFESWKAAFDRELSAVSPRHLAFGVDARTRFDCPPDFARAGLELSATTALTLTASQLRAAPAAPTGVTVRPLALPAEAPALVELDVACDDGEHEPVGYRLFRERQLARYRAMQDAGLGRWFGVFAQGRPVSACGLFRAGSLGRFQHVETHPTWRRRGLCRSLMHAVCRHGFAEMGLATLTIVADPDDVAIGLYESLGFVRGDSSWHLERAPG